MADTLVDWGGVLLEVSAPAATEKIYDYLCKLNRVRLRDLLSRLDRVRGWKCSLKGPAKTKREGKRNQVQGKLFETIVRELFRNCSALAIDGANLRTSTSEIDLLLKVLPLGMNWVPMLRSAGTHVIGEAKCHTKAPSSELVNEFVSFLNTHGASIGLLFVACAPRQIASAARTAIALHAQHKKLVVPIGKKQLDEIVNGKNVLLVLEKQYIDAAIHNVQLHV
jgi:hypothetical protein